MPGGTKEAWPHIKEMFQAIAAKVGPNDDIPCCEWVGPRGAGHYVKMVHNGIEYGDMQLICEAYQLLHEVGGLNNDELYEVFETWNQGDLQSYLIEITRDIFSVKDDQGGDGFLVDKILDVAGAKGTGKWMSQLALDLGVPSTLVTTAVFARGLSAQKEARVRASEKLHGPAAGSNPEMTAAAKAMVGDRGGIRRSGSTSPLCLQDRQLRPGLCAVASRFGRARLGARLRQCSPAVAWRLYHSGEVPRSHQGSL